jgi:hypothetical protein
LDSFRGQSGFVGVDYHPAECKTAMCDKYRVTSLNKMGEIEVIFLIHRNHNTWVEISWGHGSLLIYTDDGSFLPVS